MKLSKINPVNPQPDLISKAAGIIKRGGVVLFPTKCLYGLGADAFNADAVNKVFRIKQRPFNKPLSVLINDLTYLEKLVRFVPPAASSIIKNFWPGSITIVFEAKDTLPVNLTAGTGKIGIRLPKHTVASALVNEAGCPITGTSANISGNAGCSRVSDLDSLIADKLDLMLDAGQLEGGRGSTVVDVTTDLPEILREGAVSAKDIFAVLKATLKQGNRHAFF